MGILAAYAHRPKTGEGQWVETSLFEAALLQTYWQSAIALATGVAPRAMGSAHPLNAPYQAFEASDSRCGCHIAREGLEIICPAEDR